MRHAYFTKTLLCNVYLAQNVLLLYFLLCSFNKVDLPYDVESYNVKLQDVLNAYLEVETGIEVCFFHIFMTNNLLLYHL